MKPKQEKNNILEKVQEFGAFSISGRHETIYEVSGNLFSWHAWNNYICNSLLLSTTVLEAANLGEGKRIRRNSDSDVYSRTKEGVPLLKLRHAETELKFHKKRIAVIVREIAEELTPEILEECGLNETATFLRQNEICKGEKLIP